jgi:hypothetical protein
MKNEQFRQGDVFVQKITKIPSSATKEKCKEKIVAYGEVTGHKHVIRPVRGGVSFFNDNGQVLCSVSQEAVLVHEEHKPIMLSKGEYKVSVQREFDIVEGVRQVLD